MNARKASWGRLGPPVYSRTSKNGREKRIASCRKCAIKLRLQASLLVIAPEGAELNSLGICAAKGNVSKLVIVRHQALASRLS